MDYEDKVRLVADSLMSYRREETGWKVCKKSNDVIVSWRSSSEFPGNVYKGEGIVSGSPEKVWECLKPVPNGLRVKWDSNVKKFELLEQITKDISVCRTVTPSAALGIIAPRDFVDVVLVKQYEDGAISSNENPTKPRCSASSRQTWEVCSLALWLTRSSPPAWPSSTATWPSPSNPSETFN
ncbi:stAR-related lipid transfer protein 5 isoform 2-T2 [Pholidichthys leucotaenia]